MSIISNFTQHARKLTKKGQHNFVKVFCLGVGLALGSVLIAKVYFEQSYDGFFPNSDRIYMVFEGNNSGTGDAFYNECTSGAIAFGIKSFSPQVESATRFTYLQNDVTMVQENQKQIKVKGVSLADSCFFDVLNRQIISGNPKEVLSTKGLCMIPKSLADKMDGNPVGQKLTMQQFGDRTVIVGGVYEDLPLNSSFNDVGVLVSMPSILDYFMYDGSENWLGNDRYHSFLKLLPGTDLKDVDANIKQMMQERLPLEEMKAAGLDDFGYSLHKITDLHTDSVKVKNMIWILALLATSLLLCAVMNYLLIVIGQIVTRHKIMAVHKCYGAETKNILSMTMTEAVLHLFLSLVLATALVYVFRRQISTLLESDLSAVFASGGIWILALVILVILLVSGLVPGAIYNRIPVSSAFRNYTSTRRVWKKIMLGVQFILASFLICLLVLVVRQYNLMVGEEKGFDTTDLAYISLDGMSASDKMLLKNEVSQLSCVEDVTSSFSTYTYGYYGNNVNQLGETEQQHIIDMYDVNPNFFDMIGLDIIDGETFSASPDSSAIIVDENFVKMTKDVWHWDHVVGQTIEMSEHGVVTIKGVCRNFKYGRLSRNNAEPMIFSSCGNAVSRNLFIRFHHLDGNSVKEVQNIMKSLFPTRDISLDIYEESLIEMYSSEMRFRDSIFVAGFITLLLAIIGLLGYINDEVNRRSKEIAIRKVNGALGSDIYSLFIKDTLVMAVPALFAGSCIAFIVGGKWLQQFDIKVGNNVVFDLICLIFLLALVIAMACFVCRQIVRSNPVNYLSGD